MSLFDNRIPFKPFEYPEYYTEGWLKQAQAFWLHTEIPMQGDIKDWNEYLSIEEKNLVGNILLGFAQTECAVSDYWTTMVTNWFPKHEIKQMAMMFGSQETIHATAYSYLNESLGLDDFEAFLHEPATAERFENLAGVSNNYTYEDLKWDANARIEVARSLAIFSAFAEGVALYSSFAVLYSFQMRNLLKGIGQQMKWSVRDESLHSKMGCQLFRHMCEEYPELIDQVKPAVYEAAKVMLDLELNYIDKMFEMGDLENLKKEDLKHFIKRRVNEKLAELGYNPFAGGDEYFDYNIESANELEWFYHLTGGTTHTDFFAVRPTDYSKAGEGEDWDDIF
jgi:ribonucleoside-diphosphate reductase beta chain|tara:strand:+ start:5075 stop:6085 length:1011 start_codon:yes stop_codon:yes gene_type:complete